MTENTEKIQNNTEKNQKKIKKNKKPRTKKQLIMQIITIVLVIAAGAGSGFYCGMLYLSSKIPKVDYGQYDESFLRANAEEVLAANAGKSLAQLSAVDAFVIAQYNTQNCAQYVSETNGSLSHNFGQQNVYTYEQKYNGNYLIKEISTSSMKSVANKYLYDGTTVLAYTGTATSKTTANWSNTYKAMTNEEYKKFYGIYRYEIVSYIVSERTISESDKNAKTPGTGKKLSNGNYQFTLSLDTKSSVINHATQIKNASNISNYPSFAQMDLVFELNSDFRFASITSIECYSFSYSGIAVTCSGSITSNYDYERAPVED